MASKNDMIRALFEDTVRKADLLGVPMVIASYDPEAPRDDHKVHVGLLGYTHETALLSTYISAKAGLVTCRKQDIENVELGQPAPDFKEVGE